MNTSIVSMPAIFQFTFTDQVAADAFNLIANQATTFDTFFKKQVGNEPLSEFYCTLTDFLWDMMEFYAKLMTRTAAQAGASSFTLQTSRKVKSKRIIEKEGGKTQISTIYWHKFISGSVVQYG